MILKINKKDNDMNNVKVKVINHSNHRKCVVIKREELMKLTSNSKVRKLNVIDFNDLAL